MYIYTYMHIYIYTYICAYICNIYDTQFTQENKIYSTRYFKGTNLHFASTNICEWFFTKRFAGISFRKSWVFFTDSLQPVVAVSIQDYYNIKTFSVTVRRFLDVKRFLLKKQYESTNKYFGMTLFTWLNIVE